MGGIETERDLSLDSTFFVAFDLTHRALKTGWRRPAASA